MLDFDHECLTVTTVSASDHWHTPGWRSLAFAAGVGGVSPLLALAANAVSPWVASNRHDMPRAALIALIIIAPFLIVFEEWLFRGVILRRLVPRAGMLGALAISAALFAAAHFSLSGALGRFAVGVVLGWLYLRSRNLWVCVTAHLVHNAVLFSILAFQIFSAH